MAGPWEQYAAQTAPTTDVAGPWSKYASPTTAQQPAAATGTISATHGGAGQWLQDLESDVRHGTGTTAPGRLLQKMGAPGIDKGVREGSGDTLMSPVTGTIHAAQGVADIPKHPVQGALKTAGGVLEAATIPAAFVAPEGGEAVAKAAQGMTAGGRRQLLSEAVTNTLNKLVSTEGLEPINAKTATEAITNLSGQFKARAKAAYRAVDKAVGGELQPVLDKISDLGKAIKTNKAFDPAKADQLLEQRDALIQTKNQLISKAAQNGVTDADKVVATADRDYARYKALEGQVGKQIKTAAGEVKRGGNPDPNLFANAVDRLNNSGQLQRALGQETGEAVKDVAKAALKKEVRAKSVAKAASKTGKVVGGALGVALGVKAASKLAED